MRVLHLPHNHASFTLGLMEGARAMGHEALAHTRESAFSEAAGSLSGSRFSVWREARRADMLVFMYGSSLWDPGFRRHFLLDLPTYPKHQPRVMVFQGSDARLAYPEVVAHSREFEIAMGADLPDGTPGGVIGSDEIDRKRAKITKAARHCDRLLAANPDLLDGMPEESRFIPYPHFGPTFPAPKRREGPLRVLHMATSRVLKGSGLIESALRAASERAGIEADVRVRIPRADALAALEACDVLVDQVGLGWYGYQAVEALARGKPVLCRLDPHHFAEHVGESPEACGFVNVEPNTLADALVELFDDEDRRLALGRAGQKFANGFHDARRVVEQAYGDLLDTAERRARHG